MDKFDESIKQGSAEYQPSKNFSDQVMGKVYADSVKKHRTFGWQTFSASLAGLTAVVALVFTGTTSVFHSSQNVARGGQSTSSEFNTEMQAISQEFATDNTANSIASSELNNLSL